MSSYTVKKQRNKQTDSHPQDPTHTHTRSVCFLEVPVENNNLHFILSEHFY